MWSLFTVCLAISACIGPPLVISPAELPSAVEGTSYVATLSTDDGESQEWSVVDGELPPGLTLDEETGVLSGAPTRPGTYDFVVMVEDRGVPSRSGEQDYSLTVIPELTLGAALDPARVGVAYEDTLTILGGVPPYEVEVIGLPYPFDYDETTGRIFATPEFEDDGRQLRVTVRDSGDPQQVDTERTVLVVHPVGVSIDTTALDAAVIGEAYTMQLAASGGLQPYTWLPEEGVLPRGLSLDNDTGLISGTPTQQATTQTITFSVTDDDTPASSDTLELKLVVGVAIRDIPLDEASVGEAYDDALIAIGGLAPYTWERIAGGLPTGLELSETGVITGTPTAGAETSAFTVRVTDSDTPATTDELEVEIQVVE